MLKISFSVSGCALRCTAQDQQSHVNGQQKKKIIVVGSGWAGLGAAHHLCKQGFDVTVLEGGYGIESNKMSLSPDEIGIREAGLFLQVEFPIFQDLPQLPTLFGTLFYTQFFRMSLVDRLTSLPLMAAVVDFDNTDTAWRKWDPIKEKIFEPWMDSMRNQGCKFLEGRKVTEFLLNEETGCISELACDKESLKADAVILAVGISSLQEIIENSTALCTREEFQKVLNTSSIDLLSTKLWLDRKVNIPNASGWAFFDLNMIYDEHKDDPETVYHANELLPLKDEQVVAKVLSRLSKCIKDFDNASVIDKEIERFPKSLTHFFPGSYKYMMRGSTSFPNLFMAGDWVINRHGSWSQEKSYVVGLEAANRVVDYLGEGTFAKIIPVEEDEPHIQALRSLNRNLNEISAQLPWSDYFLQ
ncbi:unnamed protein product [Ilex paraguariensis]|uniref:Amine oxidase domain-containing protein n=1 Tax=Ilex paraguariensis TaxID=185542 RepID=A0ABC8QW65_9AQUA